METITGVKTKKLKILPDERGRLMEILRSDDEMFTKFGQVYLTTVYPGVVKAWHYHKKQLDNVVAVKGMIKLVLYDARENSKTHGKVNEICIGEHNPLLVQIPKGVYHGWRCISSEEAYVLNCTDEVYDYDNPDEFRLAPDSKDIGYDWTRKDG